MADVDDDIPQLPADTLELLNQFNADKDETTQKFEDLKARAEEAFSEGQANLSMELFTEDWNASQFWYTNDTARLLAAQLLDGVDETTSIALVSAPSVYIAVRNVLSEKPDHPRPRVVLLEYDKRFEVIGSDYVYYDFQRPLNLPLGCISSFDRVLCDPPFLSEDCQTKTALTVRRIARNWSTPSVSREGVRLISCTGERMEATMNRLYGKVGIHTTNFEPQHKKGLSNEFRCYANFECDQWKWI